MAENFIYSTTDIRVSCRTAFKTIWQRRTCHINTQPLYLVAFACFIEDSNDNAGKFVDKVSAEHYTTFEFCALLRAAFTKVHTSKNINSVFSSSGIWPLLVSTERATYSASVETPATNDFSTLLKCVMEET